MLSHIFFPRKGALTLTLGMGVGGGPFRTPKSQKIPKNPQKLQKNKCFFHITLVSKYKLKTDKISLYVLLCTRYHYYRVTGTHAVLRERVYVKLFLTSYYSSTL